MEYSLLNKDETTLSLFDGERYSVGIGQHEQASYIPIQRSFYYFISIIKINYLIIINNYYNIIIIIIIIVSNNYYNYLIILN